MFFINAIFWLWLLIVPTVQLSFFAFFIYEKDQQNLPYSILLQLAGIALGIILAELVRKKYGLDNFFGRLSATPDIDGGNILDDKQKVNKEIADKIES